MSRGKPAFSPGDWAIIASGISIASMVLLALLLMQATGDRYDTLFAVTAGLARLEALLLLVYLVVYVINLFGKRRDRRRAGLGLTSLIGAVLVLAGWSLALVFGFL